MFPYSLQQCVNQSAYLFFDNILSEASVDIHIKKSATKTLPLTRIKYIYIPETDKTVLFPLTDSVRICSLSEQLERRVIWCQTIFG